MKYIIIQHVDGSTRKIVEGEEYRLLRDEMVSGSEVKGHKCSKCGGLTEDIPAG